MAASLTIAQRTLPTAPVGAPNPLPAVTSMPQAPYEAGTDGLPEEIAANLRYGQVTSIHPYLLQDGYSRKRTEAPMRVAVLENELLRAEFALDLGGRLMRLLDKTTGRDLVYRNAIFQPANLALRNAWFSGGVEWNIGMRGHWPLTCDPLYAAELTAPDGEPVLRMWEYERVRGLIVQIDATLDDRVAALHVQVRVRNPHPHETGMYWWTNIAVAQTPGSRVYAPATHAYRTGYDGTLQYVDAADPDVSRPASAPAAADWFYDLPAAARAAGTPLRPWIAALEPDGSGLAHVSTAPLVGRKLFVWGDTTGGRHWCDWLGGATGAYFEIQAGLTTTQYEHLRMPGGATWEWRETFLPLHIDHDARDAEWNEAVAVVGDAVLKAADAATAGTRLGSLKDAEPARMLHTGSPWGALEAELAARSGASFDTLPSVRFDRDAPGAGPYWTALLDGSTGEDAGLDAPQSYVAGERWERLLAEAPASWLTHLHRAVIAHARGDLAAAGSRYEASLRQRRSPWALRGLGLVRIGEGDADTGIAHLVDALALAPDSVPIVLELGAELLRAGRAEDARGLVTSLPSAVQERGRVRVLAIRAALDAGDREAAGRLLEQRFEVPDIREGELSMSDLWRQAFPDRPVPEWYDFSMS
ncbi:DUF5107 domain-containing protein [Microbacterium sp.]|uniref:DUF5107 domain-containing protein n=1 Tax=Microbacterium sp. TaxID=51671 RepID=UPI0028119B62|nr:DUF5107 domain-containing protein [Microbacterium sp.]